MFSPKLKPKSTFLVYAKTSTYSSFKSFWRNKVKIGELSQRTGCPIARIRFYEKKGLVPKPDRTMGNQRNYTQAAVERRPGRRHRVRERGAAKGGADVRRRLCLRLRRIHQRQLVPDVHTHGKADGRRAEGMAGARAAARLKDVLRLPLHR